MLNGLHNWENHEHANKIKKNKNSPPNLKEGDIVEALDDFLLHLVNCCCTSCYTEAKLRGPPVLLNEIELAVVFRVEITQMAARLDQLLKLGLLRLKIGLRKEYTSAAAVNAVGGAAKTWALGQKIVFRVRPQAALPNDDLHALEPAGHGGVIFRKIKVLMFAVWEPAATHAWAVRVACPSFLWSCKGG